MPYLGGYELIESSGIKTATELLEISGRKLRYQKHIIMRYLHMCSQDLFSYAGLIFIYIVNGLSVLSIFEHCYIRQIECLTDLKRKQIFVLRYIRTGFKIRWGITILFDK